MKKKQLKVIAILLILLFCSGVSQFCFWDGCIYARDTTEKVSVNENDPSGFVSVSDVVPDVILEIRYYSTYNFVGDRIEGYEQPVALMTREAAAALKAVSDDLKGKGYRLKIYDAYRPQTACDHFLKWAKNTEDVRMKPFFYPQLDKATLFQQGYIAEGKSNHSRGSTVDLTMVDENTGKDVDMGGVFDYFGEVSHSDYRGISEEQYENRMILRNAMLSHGFRGIQSEWWHFTLSNEPYPNTYFTFPVTLKSRNYSVTRHALAAWLRARDYNT